MNIKKLLLIIPLIVLSIAVVGCDRFISGEGESEEASAYITLLTDGENGVESELSETARSGLEKAESELGIDGRVITCLGKEDIESNIEILVKAGKTELIIGAGERFEEAISVAGGKYPEQKFAVIDTDSDKKPSENVVYISYDNEKAGFMAGFIAGKMTSKNKVAFIGDSTSDYFVGFEKGVSASGNKVEEILTRNADPRENIDSVKSAASDVIYYGADIIFAPLSDDSISVIDQVDESSAKIIATNADQYMYSKDKVIASVMKSYDNAVYNLSSMVCGENKFEGGKNIKYNSSEGEIRLSPSTENTVPPDVILRLDKALKEEYK